MTIRTTPIAMSIHPEDQSPIFGEGCTHVLIEDESGGPFIVLRQFRDKQEPAEVRLDMEELEAVTIAARQLMEAQPK